MTDRPSPIPVNQQPERSEPTRIDHVRNDADAIKRLDDVPFVLYAVAQGVKLSWSLVCKRWPELDSRKRAA